MQVHIRSDSPVKSALGGSSTALVALIKALSKIANGVPHAKLKGHDILHLAYHLEDSVSSGKCGIQDQAAAVFGGVNQWLWHFGRRRGPYERKILLDRKGRMALSERVLVAFSGKSHVSSRINRNWIMDFLSGKTRPGWREVNKMTGHLATAIMEKKWDEAARLLKGEMAIRKKMTPDALIPLTQKLIDQAEKIGCGARFTGAGGGGAVWAIGKMDNMRQLRKLWKATLSPIRGAGILDCDVDPVGVR